MALGRLAVLLAVLAGCGGTVDPTPPPSPAPAKPGAPPYDGPLGTVTGKVDVHLGRSVQDSYVRPVQTTVVLYPLLNFSISHDMPNGEAAARTESSAAGLYSLSAPPGAYTLLVIYEGTYEPSSVGDLKNPVQVEAGKSIVADVRVERNADF